MMYQRVIATFYVLASCTTLIYSQQCNSTSGPAGTTECVLLTPYYQKYQWATCLTNAYIKQKSAYRHQCRNIFATYCWYQCQIEVHGNDKGDVSDDCRCKAGDQATTKSPLPSWCYSPPGDTCSWYADCLQKYKDCSNSKANYAVNYASHFCNLYKKRYSTFTTKGKQWVDATRKCLQVSLVPILRAWNTPTCDEIQKTAFDSHTCCYVAGSSCAPKGTPSICDLPLSDWLEVFWTVKGAFNPFSKSSAPLESIYGIFGTAKGCTERTDLYKGFQNGWKAIKGKVRQMEVYLKSILGGRRKREALQTVNSTMSINDEVAFKVVQDFAFQVDWDKNHLDWFGYGIESNSTMTTIRILLFDKSSLNDTSTNKKLLNDSVESFMHDMQLGKIGLQDNEMNNRFQLEFVSTCGDFDCIKKDATVKVPVKKSSDGVANKSYWLAYSITLVLVLLNFLS